MVVGWPGADVGDRRADDPVDDGRRRVDAVRRNELVVGTQIGGREANRATALVAVDDHALDDVRMTEQRARLVHTGLGDQAAHARTADDEILVAHGIDLLGFESVPCAERSQQRKVARAIVAEEEIGADPHLRHAQPLDKDVANERLGIPLRELGREAHDGRALDAGLFERLEFLSLRHDERRRFVGSDDTRRVRIEGHHHRRGAPFAGDAAQPFENLAVAAVHAVEVAER